MATLERGAGPTGEVVTSDATPTDCLTAAVAIAPGETMLVEGILIARSGAYGIAVRTDAVASRSADGSTLSVSTAGVSVGGDVGALPGATGEWVANGNAEVAPRVTGVAATTISWIATSRYNKRVT